MNQILDYNLNNKSDKSGGSDNIVRVFAIILILFAIALIAVVGYGMISNKEDVNDINDQITYADINIEIDGAQGKISVTHDKIIKKMIYSWDDGSERPVTGKDKFLEEPIDVPAGDHTLYIKVIDEIGTETTYNEEISSDEGVDIINPIIELAVTDDKKLKITATDETALDFLTYRWNDDEEQKVFAEEDSKKIEIEIEILKGKNDLTVSAVDASNNTTTDSKSFNGLTKPEITVTLSADGSSIDIKAYHENGIKSVRFNFNNADYNFDIGDDTPDTIQFSQNLDVGYNRIILTVESIDGIESKFDGECTYGGPEQSN